MDHKNLLVIGGSGFIGHHLVAQLAAQGKIVTVPTRRFARARHLLPLPGIDVVEADVHDDAMLAKLVGGADAVINLVGILHSKRGKKGADGVAAYGPAFAKAHVELPARIAAACVAAGVTRLLHMSALGASENAPSMYLRSKAAGERAVLRYPELGVTIFRPSVVFGEDDKFLNLFATLQKFIPVMLLGGADAKFQPVFVGDVVRAFVQALDDPRAIGKIIELVGPHVYRLRELVRLAGEYSGHPRPVIGLPASLAKLQAWMLELMPGGPLMSRDNLDSMHVDNVATEPVDPVAMQSRTSLEAVAPIYLSPSARRRGR